MPEPGTRSAWVEVYEKNEEMDSGTGVISCRGDKMVNVLPPFVLTPISSQWLFCECCLAYFNDCRLRKSNNEPHIQQANAKAIDEV